VVGEAPVAQALRAIAPHVGLEAADGDIGAEDLALVVASHGRDEEPALVAALTAGVPYVGLVASERRGDAVRASLDVPDELRDRLRTPAGLAIGARTPAEIALSILAEIVRERRAAVPQWAPVHSGDHHCHHEH
jgi:xanthine dehydrogenase accessory factor